MIPALDEADWIQHAISSARVQGEDIEIRVVDGGSQDATVDRARAAGADVMASPRGRARQLDAGWRATGGDVIVFLHADTRLGDGWTRALRRALEDPEVVGGAFRLSFDARTTAMRCVEWGARLRVALFAPALRRPGDLRPALRCSRRSAACRTVALMEDLDLVAREAARPARACWTLPVTTSARRYRSAAPCAHGLWPRRRAGGWRLGVDRARIARGWADERRARSSRPPRPAIRRLGAPRAAAAVRSTCAATAATTRSGPCSRSPTSAGFVAVPLLVGWAIDGALDPRRSAARGDDACAARSCSPSRSGAGVLPLLLARAGLQRGARGRVRDAQRSLRPPPAAAPVLLLPLADRRPDEPLRERPELGAAAARPRSSQRDPDAGHVRLGDRRDVRAERQARAAGAASLSALHLHRARLRRARMHARSLAVQVGARRPVEPGAGGRLRASRW